jgi:hypothetical protein
VNHFKSITEMLETKFGDEKSADLLNRVKHAYRSGIRGNRLSVYLKDVLKEEGMIRGGKGKPPIIYWPGI